jgi:glycosyltransferase involved in cell wall biosynthesis
VKIAYLGQMADVATENGISKKIRMQATAWLAAGHQVRYFSLEPTTTAWAGLSPLETEIVARGQPLTRALRSRQLAARVEAWRPDVIYFRYAYHSPGFPALFRAIPTVAEINSDDQVEYALTLSRVKQLYHRLTRRRVLRAVTAFVPVTRELAERFAAFRHPAEVIGNSIRLDDFEPLPAPTRDAPMRAIFVGSARTPWHGLDRVAELAAIFPEIGFDVIGCTEPEWRRITAGAAAAPTNVAFHGSLPHSRYEPIARAATFALGTFGLYRKRMDEACPLKVREYLAFGLPVLAAYRDTDVPDDADYFKRLPNDAAPLAPHRLAIAAWIEKWRGRRVARARIAHLDTTVKEHQRLAFMARIAQCRR